MKMKRAKDKTHKAMPQGKSMDGKRTDGPKKKKLQGALFGGKRPGGRDSVKKRESRLEGKPL